MTRTAVESANAGGRSVQWFAEPALGAGTTRRPGRIASLWRRASLRSQILGAVVLVNMVAGILAAIVVIYDARHAARIEIDASMRVAEQFVIGAIERHSLQPGQASVLATLAMQVGDLRHIRIHVVDANGMMPLLLPTEQGTLDQDESSGAPEWFRRLINVDDVRREMKIGLDGRRIGSVILIGDASDEIAEVWSEVRKLFAIAIILNLVIFTILFFALGGLLRPLARLGQGLRQLEEGQFRHRLSHPNVKELASISDRFNALADRLAIAKAENGRLTRRLVTVQDDERKDVATELHDEIGPCLFAVKANVASLDKFARQLPSASADRMRERIAIVSEIADTIQALNRRLLNRIRPMALGHVPLEELLSGLLTDFRRLHPELNVSAPTFRVQHSYGDTVDLTIYRCMQEGLNNVARHSGATSAVISLQEQAAVQDEGLSEGDPLPSIVRLTLRDNGRGMTSATSWGFGVTSMDERVRALGGNLTIASQEAAGTVLEIIIPVDGSQRPASPTWHRSEHL